MKNSNLESLKETLEYKLIKFFTEEIVMPYNRSNISYGKTEQETLKLWNFTTLKDSEEFKDFVESPDNFEQFSDEYYIDKIPPFYHVSELCKIKNLILKAESEEDLIKDILELHKELVKKCVENAASTRSHENLIYIRNFLLNIIENFKGLNLEEKQKYDLEKYIKTYSSNKTEDKYLFNFDDLPTKNTYFVHDVNSFFNQMKNKLPLDELDDESLSKFCLKKIN